MVLQGVDMKYIDPSYQIRAVPTNCNDRIYCKVGAITAICEVNNASTMKSIFERPAMQPILPAYRAILAKQSGTAGGVA